MIDGTSDDTMQLRAPDGRISGADGDRGDGGGEQGAGKGVARSSLLMATGTVVSRATGLIRTVLQAAALGTGLLATTYNTANIVPMSIYTLLIGGALNSVLVPQLVRARAEHADGGRAYEQRLVTLVLSVLAVGTLLSVWAAPQIVAVYTADTPGATRPSNSPWSSPASSSRRSSSTGCSSSSGRSSTPAAGSAR